MTGIRPIFRRRARKPRDEMTPQERKVWAKLLVLRWLGADQRVERNRNAHAVKEGWG